MTRDDRTAAEKAAWDAGRFTEEEAAGGGVTVEEAPATTPRGGASRGGPFRRPAGEPARQPDGSLGVTARGLGYGSCGHPPGRPP